jgi:hypothetical protein
MARAFLPSCRKWLDYEVIDRRTINNAQDGPFYFLSYSQSSELLVVQSFFILGFATARGGV